MYHFETTNKDVCYILCGGQVPPKGFHFEYKKSNEIMALIELILRNSKEKKISFSVWQD